MSYQQIEGCADIYLSYKKYKCYVKKQVQCTVYHKLQLQPFSCYFAFWIIHKIYIHKEHRPIIENCDWNLSVVALQLQNKTARILAVEIKFIMF